MKGHNPPKWFTNPSYSDCLNLVVYPHRPEHIDWFKCR